MPPLPMSICLTNNGAAGLLTLKTSKSGLLPLDAVALTNTYGNLTATSVPSLPGPISAAPRIRGAAQLPLKEPLSQPPTSGFAQLVNSSANSIFCGREESVCQVIVAMAFLVFISMVEILIFRVNASLVSELPENC